MLCIKNVLLFLSIGSFVTSDVGVAYNGCTDLNDHCGSWKQSGFCTDSRYTDYMTKNCKKSCNLCGICKDDNDNCAAWASYGYCTSDLYQDYMTKTCQRSCNLCGGPTEAPVTTQPPVTTLPPTTGGPVTAGPQGSILKGCSFNNDLCDWINIPFDDKSDFKITSGSVGSGPNAGMGGQGGYAYVSSTSKSNAKLLLPIELLLNHNSNHGTVCMTFAYYMAGSGTLYLKEIKNVRNAPTRNLKVISGYQGNQWKTVQVNVQVSSDFQLMFEANPQSSVIAIDEIRFSDSRCV